MISVSLPPLRRSEKEGGGLVRIPPPDEPPGGSPASSNSGKVACRARTEKEDDHMSLRTEKTDLHAPVSFCTLWRSDSGNQEVRASYDPGANRFGITFVHRFKTSGQQEFSSGFIAGNSARDTNS